MGRSSLRHKRDIYGVDSAGETPDQHGEQPTDVVPPDIPNPVVIAASIDSDGTTLKITFNRLIENSTGFALTADAAGKTLGSPSVSGRTITFSVSTAVTAGQVCLLSYTAGDVEALAGDDPLLDFTDLPVRFGVPVGFAAGETSTLPLTKWPEGALTHLLDTLRISYPHNPTRDQLVALVPDTHHSQIAEDVPSDTWTVDEIKQWLDARQVSYTGVTGKDNLLYVVKQTIALEAVVVHQKDA